MRVLPQWAQDALGLPPEATSTARNIDALHASVIGTTLIGTSVVALVTCYFVFRYRRRTVGAATPRIVASTRREWFIASALLVLFLAFWAVGYSQYLTLERAPANAQIVYVTAKQWTWKFGYTNGKTTNDELVVRAHTPVRLVMVSRDVIHSFYVPAFRVKQDVLPNRYVNLWFEGAEPGTYPIYCAEYCGVSHSIMRGEVRVLSDEDYAKWADSQGADDLVTRGRIVATKHECLACHTVDGQRHTGPTWVGLFGSLTKLDDGRTVLVDEGYLTRSMMEPLADRVAGYQPIMPTYRGSLSNEEVGALVEYIRSLQYAPSRPSVVLPPLETTDPPFDGGTEASP